VIDSEQEALTSKAVERLRESIRMKEEVVESSSVLPVDVFKWFHLETPPPIDMRAFTARSPPLADLAQSFGRGTLRFAVFFKAILFSKPTAK
jgi:hypothetical protein